MNYNLSAKVNGKWWRFGKFETNKFGNLQAGFKVTPELVKLVIDNEGKWINFSAFEEKPKPVELDDEIPY